MPNGINLATYHRGDLEGNACKALMHNALKIFSEIKEFLIVTVAGGDEDTKTKIKEVYDAVTCCLMLFPRFSLLSICTPSNCGCIVAPCHSMLMFLVGQVL